MGQPEREQRNHCVLLDRLFSHSSPARRLQIDPPNRQSAHIERYLLKLKNGAHHATLPLLCLSIHPSLVMPIDGVRSKGLAGKKVRKVVA